MFPCGFIDTTNSVCITCITLYPSDQLLHYYSTIKCTKPETMPYSNEVKRKKKSKTNQSIWLLSTHVVVFTISVKEHDA